MNNIIFNYEDFHWVSDFNGYETDYPEILVVGCYKEKETERLFLVDTENEHILEELLTPMSLSKANSNSYISLKEQYIKQKQLGTNETIQVTTVKNGKNTVLHLSLKEVQDILKGDE